MPPTILELIRVRPVRSRTVALTYCAFAWAGTGSSMRLMRRDNPSRCFTSVVSR